MNILNCSTRCVCCVLCCLWCVYITWSQVWWGRLCRHWCDNYHLLHRLLLVRRIHLIEIPNFNASQGSCRRDQGDLNIRAAILLTGNVDIREDVGNVSLVLSMWILNALGLALKFGAVLCSRFNPGCVQLYAAEERLGWSLPEKHFSWPVMPISLRISSSLSMWLLDTLDLSLEFNAVLCSSFNPGCVRRLWFLNITDAASHCGGRWVDSGCVRTTFVMSWVFTWACVCKYPCKLWSWTCYSSWQEMKVMDIHSWVVLLILFSNWSSRVGAEDSFQYEDWTVSYIVVSPLGVWQQVSFALQIL